MNVCWHGISVTFYGNTYKDNKFRNNQLKLKKRNLAINSFPQWFYLFRSLHRFLKRQLRFFFLRYVLLLRFEFNKYKIRDVRGICFCSLKNTFCYL